MNFKILMFLFLPSVIMYSQSKKENNYYKETYRPQFHYSPEKNWMNDPNGLVYYNGTYHLFYQYYPGDIVWGPMHWGHASSSDLIHWKHQPIALYPDALGDIFSGSAVIDKNNTAGFGENTLIAIFTYHNDSAGKIGYPNTESQGIAFSLDEGLSWEKFEGNPVLANSSEKDFRDPKVFWNEDTNEWVMVLAVGDRLKIFSSNNLKDWKFKSDFKPGNDLTGLGVWECPDLFKMKSGDDEKWVMIINHGNNAPNGGSGTRYFIGSFDGETFLAEQPSIWLDHGTDFYAGVTFNNIPDDKRIIISWMSNWMYATKTPTNAWRGAMTLPRELILNKDRNGYFLRQKIAGNFTSNKHKIKSDNEVDLPYIEKEIDLSQAEIQFDYSGYKIAIVLSSDLGDILRIELLDNRLFIDKSQSGLTGFSEKFADRIQSMPVDEDIFNFQVILDRASVEILLNNGKYSMTNIFFPHVPFSILQISGGLNSKLNNFRINSIERVW